MSLNLRRRSDGSLSVVGDPPAAHIFATSFIERAIGDGSVSVTVELNTADGPVRYRLVGLVGEDGTSNTTAWSCELLGG